MSIRWIRNVKIDGKPATLEILLGEMHISDKCYFKINDGAEHWFTPVSESREEILKQAEALLKEQLKGKNVSSLSGQPFDWT